MRLRTLLKLSVFAGKDRLFILFSNFQTPLQQSTLEGKGLDFPGEFGDAIYDLDGYVVYYDYMFRSLNGESNIFKELENLIKDTLTAETTFFLPVSVRYA